MSLLIGASFLNLIETILVQFSKKPLKQWTCKQCLLGFKLYNTIKPSFREKTKFVVSIRVISGHSNTHMNQYHINHHCIVLLTTVSWHRRRTRCSLSLRFFDVHLIRIIKYTRRIHHCFFISSTWTLRHLFLIIYIYSNIIHYNKFICYVLYKPI